MKSNKLKSDGTYTHMHNKNSTFNQIATRTQTMTKKAHNSQQQGTANPNMYRYCIAGSLLRSQHNKILWASTLHGVVVVIVFIFVTVKVYSLNNRPTDSIDTSQNTQISFVLNIYVLNLLDFCYFAIFFFGFCLLLVFMCLNFFFTFSHPFTACCTVLYCTVCAMLLWHLG